MCTHDSHEAGLFGEFRLMRTCTHDSYKAGLFGDFRLIRTCVFMILIRQDCLVTLD